MIQNILLNTQMIRMTFIKKKEDYNPNKKRKILIVFDDIIANMLSNETFIPVVTELFIR